MNVSKFATAVLTIQLFAVLAAGPALAADKTMSGKVSDAMCGAKAPDGGQ